LCSNPKGFAIQFYSAFLPRVQSESKKDAIKTRNIIGHKKGIVDDPE